MTIDQIIRIKVGDKVVLDGVVFEVTVDGWRLNGIPLELTLCSETYGIQAYVATSMGQVLDDGRRLQQVQ